VEGVAADPSYLDISVPPGKQKRLTVETTRNAFAYVFAGSGTFRDASDPQGGLTKSGAPGLATGASMTPSRVTNSDTTIFLMRGAPGAQMRALAVSRKADHRPNLYLHWSLRSTS
jgi:redox-sensitive bicupin YhaK (pirin superfamily)